MSGHSKCTQIKHKKAITDAKRGRLFSKILREIFIAARTGVPNPEANPRLRSAVERAKSQGLPKDTIERAIAKASGDSDAAELQEFLYEATAPGGIVMLIEGITDNKNRSFAEIRHILSERGAKIADPGSVLWSFDKIGTLLCAEDDNTKKTKEDIELAIIEAGATDFHAHKGVWYIETSFTELDKVKRAIELAYVMIKESGHDYKPKNLLSLPARERDMIEPLLDALINHDDVHEAYTNLIPLVL